MVFDNLSAYLLIPGVVVAPRDQLDKLVFNSGYDSRTSTISQLTYFDAKLLQTIKATTIGSLHRII